tara:strand:+ start:228 stop:1133 length:906 start_codon:yes stop_codon:yes gene_type:complete
MNKLHIISFLSLCSLLCFGQANLKKDSNPFIIADIGYGTSGSFAGLSVPLGNSQSYLCLRYLQNLSINDSSANRNNQWYGLDKSISLNKKTELIVGLGYLTNIQRSVAFDVSPKVGLQTMVASNLYTGVSYFQVIPRHIKTSYQPILTLDLKYILFHQNYSNGLTKRKGQNKEIFASATFGTYYSSLGLDLYSLNRNRLGLSARIYTDFGTLFETENHAEWQLLALNYRYSLTREIEITGLAGFASEFKPLLKAFSPLFGLNLRALIYENIYFTIETSQTSKTLVRERRQPIVHLGLSVSL